MGVFSIFIDRILFTELNASKFPLKISLSSKLPFSSFFLFFVSVNLNPDNLLNSMVVGLAQKHLYMTSFRLGVPTINSCMQGRLRSVPSSINSVTIFSASGVVMCRATTKGRGSLISINLLLLSINYYLENNNLEIII